MEQLEKQEQAATDAALTAAAETAATVETAASAPVAEGDPPCLAARAARSAAAFSLRPFWIHEWASVARDVTRRPASCLP